MIWCKQGEQTGCKKIDLNITPWLFKLKALAQPACFATMFLKTGITSYYMKIQSTKNFSRQLPLSMPVEPLSLPSECDVKLK